MATQKSLKKPPAFKPAANGPVKSSSKGGLLKQSNSKAKGCGCGGHGK